MNDIEKANVARMIDRLEDLKRRSNGSFNPPAWMLDKTRYGKGSLTNDEMHEWAETICQSIRTTVALNYLLRCAKKWGYVNGEGVFKSGNDFLGINEVLIENILISKVEHELIELNPEERYISVYQFYAANENNHLDPDNSWFTSFLDGVLTEVANKLRLKNERMTNFTKH
ncbi:hypothetical protein ACQV2B_19125 [Pantoea allii]|uniref:hypothetical protein n=1 Tax=Pantoea allii TaxID=574096 RepID=UPI003D31D2D4